MMPRKENIVSEYHIVIKNGKARGVLKDGTPFLLDAEDIHLIKDKSLRLDDTGYVVTHHNGKTNFKLQNIVMGKPKNNTLFWDHINRDKTDNRKCNLRLVNNQQNQMNKKGQSNSFCGLKGVTYVKSKNTYKARIWLNGICVYLGSSRNPVIAAQMYNEAARLLFGEFAGGLNDVPKPNVELISAIYNKCKSRLNEAHVATRPVSCFS